MTKVVGEVAIDVTADIGPLVSGMKRGETAVDSFRDAVDMSGRRLKDFGYKADRLGRTLSAVSAAISAASGGAFFLAKGAAGSAKQISNLSRLANTSTDEFQKMAAGAKTVGIEQDKLADIFKDVNDRVGDFISTGGGPMADFFENVAPKVGVTADQFARLSGPEALQLYADSLKKANLSQAETTFYMEAISSGATALLPLLANNGAEFKRLGEQAASAGAIINSDAIKASENFNTSLTNLQQAFEGVRNKIAVSLMPAFTRIMDGIVVNVIPAVDSAISKFGDFADYISNLPGPILEAVGVIGGALGVGGPILIGVGLVSKAIGGLIAATGPIGLFIAAASLLAAAWVAWGDDIKEAIGSAAEYITTAFDEALAAVTGFSTQAMEGVTGAVDWMQTQFTGFLEFVRTIPVQMLEIGTQMIQGLLDGIMLKWEELKMRIYELGALLPQWMREMLDIQSPSRVFAEIGNYIGEGLAMGIAQSHGMVNTAVRTLGDGAVSATQGMASQVMGILGTMFAGNKKIAAAQALVNAWAGASEALKLPFPKNLIAFGQVLATGMGAVRAIKSAQIGGGGAAVAGAATSGAAATPPPTQIYLDVQPNARGDIPMETFRGLVDSINEQLDRGGVLVT